MSDIQFTVGVFQDFRAKVGFHLGRLSHDLKKDAIVQFDGTTLKMDGVVHSYPELRSAIRSEWLCLVGSNVGDYVAKSANVKVRGAKAGDPPASTVVQRDETYIAPAIRKSATATTTDGVRMETKPFNSALVKDTEGDGRSVGSAIRSKAASVPTGGSQSSSSDGELVGRVKSNVKTSFTLDGSTTMKALDDGTIIGSEGIRGVKPTVRNMGNSVDEQEAQVVGGIKTPAKRKATVENSNSATQAINKIDSAPRSVSVVAPKNKAGVSAVSGDNLEEILPALDPGGQAALVADQKRRERLAAVAKSEGKKAPPAPAPVAPTPAAPAKTTKPVKTAAPKSVEDFIVNGDDVEIAPGLRWNKKLHWRIRVKTALTYKDKPEILKVILAHEVPAVAKIINEALAV